MLIIGLTGSIATGKSTVSDILRAEPHNLPIIDADVIARVVVEPGTPGYEAIVKHFGSTTPDLLEPGRDGNDKGPKGLGRPLNRAALGKRVFGQGTEAERKVLNGIVHPAVRAEIRRRILIAHWRRHWAVVLDVPLLFESGLDLLCGTVLVVGVSDKDEQIRRLLARDAHLSREDAGNRVDSQWDVRDKAVRAQARGPKSGFVVWNDGTKEQLKAQVDRAIKQMRESSPWWWTFTLWLIPPAAITSAVWNVLLSWWAKRKWDQQQAREKAKL